MIEFDRDGPVQWYVQIADVVRDRIRHGTYELNRKIPSEIALGEEFEVSRPTVREGLAILTEEGLVKAIRGKGTYVVALPAED